MKKLILVGILGLFSGIVFAQAQYNGALERYQMKSDKAVREGLVGEYYSGANFNQLVRVKQDKEIYFDWDYKNPIPELASDYFSIRWRGKVYAEKQGKYVFTIYTDDGMRLWLNGKIIINAWKDQPPTLYESLVILEEDEFYDIRVDYYQKEYQTTAAVFFNPEGEDRKPLNASNTIFGNNLEASNAQFDFWEKPGLLDDFWVWMGMEEEKVPRPFVDQSFKNEPISIEKLKPVRSEQNADEEIAEVESIVEPSKKVKSNTPESEKSQLIEEDYSDNKYEKLQAGETLVIENIYFDQGKAKLRPESFEELNKLLIAMQHHPDWKIKIDGHTDNVGYAVLNLELSFDRARSVYFYLINNGIEKSRLGFEGFGSSRPLAKNDTEANKQLNRRVEVSLSEDTASSMNQKSKNF